MRLLIATLSVASMWLGSQAAAEPPVTEAADSSEKTAPSASDEEMSQAELLDLARRQGFMVIDEGGTLRICKSSKELGSRLKGKLECFTPKEWKTMANDTRDKFRDQTRKQLNRQGG